jgi:hypothetical protein
VEISNICHSPVLTPADFFFPTLKTALKVKKFQDVEDIKKNVMVELNTVPLEVFTVLKPFLKATTQVDGDYFGKVVPVLN